MRVAFDPVWKNSRPKRPRLVDVNLKQEEDAHSPLPILWFDEIQPVLDAQDFVQGVLVEQGSVVVYGESNAGKTFWVTDLALHVAAGFSWNGRRVEQGGVIYCALEGGVGFRNRVAAWRDHHGLEEHRIPFAAIPAGLNLLDPEADTPRLISIIESVRARMVVPVKLIIIDTLARAFAGGNENSSEDMGALVLNMDEIRMKTGACVVFVHHSGKDQAKGARGHSSLRAAIDTEIEVVATEGELKSATIVKQRELKKGSVFNFTLKVVELGVNRHGEKVTTCVPIPDDGSAPTFASRTASVPKSLSYPVQMLERAMSKHGGILPPRPGLPANVVGVYAEQFRAELYAGMPAAEPDAKRQAYKRALDGLLRLKIIASFEDLIWFVRA